MAITRLRICVGYKKQEEIKLPVYKNIEVEEEFIKVFGEMGSLFAVLNKIEILLIFFLVQTMSNECVVYNNKIVRTTFINHVRDISKGKITYQHQSVHNAFGVLRKEGLLINEYITEIVGAYFVNPAYIYIGDKRGRNEAITNIERETNAKFRNQV